MASFTPDFLDELRSRLRASDVVGRYVKLKKEGREWRGLSPFTSEKTPSFFVNDEKARWFDFSSSKNGDVIGFYMEHLKLSFPEAVERLAEEAGLQVPKDTPEEKRRAERAKGLAEACAEAARFFRVMLGRAEGADARAYLDRRMVAQREREAFGLGYAPQSRTALLDHLLNKDFPKPLLIEAGLVIQLEDGSTYDRFRDRLMFPILGSKDRVIAFGGRALSKDAKAKYLNSPETPLFHKSAVLYDFARARRRAGGGAPLLVTEGYMDVIAAAGVGYAATAPLGTALTEGQLTLLWRASDEPVLCFDGDRAGQAAAWRAAERALPLLTPGKSLRFAFLPEGMDPDDLIRRDGKAAFDGVVEKAQPLAEVLWTRHVESHARGTPEEAAAFKRAAWDLVRQIKDEDVNEAYAEFLRGKLGAGAAPAAPAAPGRKAWLSPAEFRRRRDAPTVSPALKARLGAGIPQDAVREAQLIVTLIHHPALFTNHEAAVLDLDVQDEGLRGLLMHAVGRITESGSLDSEALRSHMLASPGTAEVYQRWSKHPLVRLARFTSQAAPYDAAEEGWLNALSIDRYQGDLEGEVAEAAAEAHLDTGRERTWFDAFNHRARLLAENKPDDDETDG
ncbi:DNA primase [Parvularcula dongshanensis]|uniref:DNA primase n=1 Tax=Parvularcula dongshanensis TaxID=1173995 RepID=A0A840I751_9PROT|nr:DNA primase [Parvularcula dongshanensis]MBB4660091.1 DNA primase [Parvularcula dongshanensis]